MSTQIYTTDDRILPMIEMGEYCPIQLQVSDDSIRLSIATRDIEWDRKTGKVIHTGTFLGGRLW